MPTNLTDVDTFTATIAVPASADARTAASVQTPFQSLANRTAYLKERLDRMSGLYEDSATRVLDVSSWVFSDGDWEVFNSAKSLQALTNSAIALIPIDAANAPHGCTITGCSARVQTSHADTGSDRISVSIARCSTSTTETVLSAVAYDNGTATEQTISISGESIVIDRATYRYYIKVNAGANAASYSKKIYGASVTRTLP